MKLKPFIDLFFCLPLLLSICWANDSSSGSLQFPELNTNSETGKQLQNFSLQEAIAAALKHSFELRSVQQKKSMADAEFQVNISSFRPNMSMYGQSGYRNPTQGPSNPLGSGQYLVLNAQLQQYLYGFGFRKSAYAAAKNRIEMADIEILEEKSLLEYKVRTHFSQVLWAKEKLKTLQASTRLNATELEISQKSLSLGRVSEIEFRQTRKNWLNAKSLERQAQHEVQESLSQLNRTIGVSNISPIGHLGEENFNQGQNLLNERLASSATVLWLKAAIEGSKQQSISYKNSTRPQLSFILSGERSGKHWDDAQNDWRAGLQLAWKLDTQLETRYNSLAQEHLSSAYRFDLEKLLMERKEQFLLIMEQAENLKERLSLQEQILVDTEKNYQSLLEVFRVGSTTYSQVEEARLALTESELEMSQLLWQWDQNSHMLVRWLK